MSGLVEISRNIRTKEAEDKKALEDQALYDLGKNALKQGIHTPETLDDTGVFDKGRISDMIRENHNEGLAQQMQENTKRMENYMNPKQ